MVNGGTTRNVGALVTLSKNRRPSMGVGGDEATAFGRYFAANFPRSVFMNRASFPLSEISRKSVACGVMPSGLVHKLFAVTIHHGRHTFISHALAGGRTLAEVRDAAGHANVSITSWELVRVRRSRQRSRPKCLLSFQTKFHG
jgi:integrase